MNEQSHCYDGGHEEGVVEDHTAREPQDHTEDVARIRSGPIVELVPSEGDRGQSRGEQRGA
ncbi:hypothetical protein [Streptomyces sp. NPDC050804]|uniref:hypothetical protein n=1 Tax=Streptomyces sp. NPDC050804 TaxID=3154745 RepID=UPI0034491944